MTKSNIDEDNPQKAHFFTFGDPESILDNNGLMDYFEVTNNSVWYEPPFPFNTLNKSLRMAAHHQSAISLKRNALTKYFKPHPFLSKTTFKSYVQDFLVTGNAYLERIDNIKGQLIELKHSPAKNMRVGVKKDQYYFVKDHEAWFGPGKKSHKFRRGSIYHLLEAAQEQEIYGVPDYLSAFQSGLLNEAATLFRRRYYQNGSHAGFVFYLSEASMNATDVDNLREQLRKSKGVGNFKNLFVHAPDGKKDGIQILPISEVAAKDEWFSIKRVTRDDILAAHRVPPQLIGVVPENNGGFGDIRSAAMIFHQQEIEPLQESLLDLNNWLGIEVIQFSEYQALKSGGPKVS